MYQSHKRSKIADTSAPFVNPIEVPALEIKQEPVEIKEEPLEIKYEPLQIVFGTESLYRIPSGGDLVARFHQFCSCYKPSVPTYDDGWFLEDKDNNQKTIRECHKFRECRTCGRKIPSQEKVFGTKSILEKILIYAIHSGDRKLDLKAIQNVRITNKRWLLTLTNLLMKFGKPVIKLTLNETKSLKKSRVLRKASKVLNSFTQTFTTSDVIVESAISFSLRLTESFFERKNYDSLVKCLRRLGSSLFELHISYPKCGATFIPPGDFPKLDLPSLKQLSFQFSDKNIQGIYDPYAGCKNFIGIHFLRELLNGATNLKEFVHPFTTYPVYLPRGFENLKLSETILTLNLNARMHTQELKVLLKNDLPNLKCLTLLINDRPFDDDLLHNILERVQKSLSVFEIEGLSTIGYPRPRTYLRFPLMKYLENIYVGSTCCELGPGELPFNWHECLPNLKALKIVNQTELAVKKWILNSRFVTVEDLEISMLDEHFKEKNENKFVSLNAQLLEGVHKAFPSVQSLALTFNVNDMSALQFIFQKLTLLKVLSIELRGNLKGYCSDQFDSNILGMSVRQITCLREYGDLFEKVEFIKSKQASIQDLQALTKLVLWTPPNSKGEKNYLSEVIIKYGFSKMPKLENVELHGKFKPTGKIDNLWQKECSGCKKTYYDK